MVDEQGGPSVEDIHDVDALETTWTDVVKPGGLAILQALAEPGSFDIQPGSSLYGDDKRTDPFLASTAVMVSLSMAADAFVAAATLADANPRHSYSPAILTRSAIEGSATALWILRGSSRRERVCRALRWWRENDRNRQKFQDGLAGSAPSSDTARVTIDEVATAYEIDPKETQTRDSATTIVGALGTFELAVWQVFSGMAHGLVWGAMTGLEHEIFEERRSGVHLARITNNRSTTITGLMIAFIALRDATTILSQRVRSPCS